MDKVAVVILNWNGAGMLRKFLSGVVAHTRGQVYVADNASTDDSMSLLAAEFPEVRTLVLDRNYGFAEGYNRALAQIDAEYYVLLNSDVEVKDDWITPMLDYLDAHPAVAACQPKILSQLCPQQFEYAGAAGGFLDGLGYPYCRGRVFDTVERDAGQYDQVVPVFWATGAALMVRAQVFREVGGLDARFFAHMEEIDFCWRLRSRGWSIVCIPDSVVWHVGGGTLPKENPWKTYLNFRNNLYMLYKNLPDRRLHKVFFVRFWLDMLAGVVFMLKGEWRSCKAVFRAYSDFLRDKSDFDEDRAVNRRMTVVDPIPEQEPGCLLWSYHIRRCHLYSDLRNS